MLVKGATGDNPFAVPMLAYFTDEGLGLNVLTELLSYLAWNAKFNNIRKNVT